MINIGTGQEMKISIKSSDSNGNKSKTIRYLNPLAESAQDTNITGFVKILMQNSTDNYISTSGSIELGILDE